MKGDIHNQGSPERRKYFNEQLYMYPESKAKYEIFEFEVLFEPFLFFQYDEIQDFVNKQNINSAKIAGGDIFYKNFDKEYQEKEYISLYNEKVVKNEEVFKFMCANYNSSNNSNYNYNKEYNLSFLGVRAEEQ